MFLQQKLQESEAEMWKWLMVTFACLVSGVLVVQHDRRWLLPRVVCPPWGLDHSLPLHRAWLFLNGMKPIFKEESWQDSGTEKCWKYCFFWDSNRSGMKSFFLYLMGHQINDLLHLFAKPLCTYVLSFSPLLAKIGNINNF